ncbi:hypothetical protein HMPREF0381_2000 [Lachnoanaerobaculum saburreum DSM 3986]|uniref:Uncharacterized protein n=1 Tax=Lachnoanaerobaculum saburreum DSM 3986 TaxID=887325 RepID=E6LPW5_9FIRM|nr:hypothetical protein HMPREF0381_2000 [Lachnoanaerobaculum saburreum DSM 3986]
MFYGFIIIYLFLFVKQFLFFPDIYIFCLTAKKNYLYKKKNTLA